MHGSVLSSFRTYVTGCYGQTQWEAIVKAAGASGTIYVPARIYPDAEAVALFDATARHAGISSKQLQEQFGEYLAPSLLKLYGAMLPAPWSTLDLAQNSATLVHRVLRMRNPDAAPPRWYADRISPDEVHIDYNSSRRTCGLFIGIMRGFAASRNETVEVTEPHCQHRGDPACEIVLRANGAEAKPPP